MSLERLGLLGGTVCFSVGAVWLRAEWGPAVRWASCAAATSLALLGAGAVVLFGLGAGMASRVRRFLVAWCAVTTAEFVLALVLLALGVQRPSAIVVILFLGLAAAAGVLPDRFWKRA